MAVVIRTVLRDIYLQTTILDLPREVIEVHMFIAAAAIYRLQTYSRLTPLSACIMCLKHQSVLIQVE